MRQERVYEIELKRAHDEGFDDLLAERVARERAEQKFWEMVDDARHSAAEYDR